MDKKPSNFYSEEGRQWHRKRIKDGISKARKAGVRIGRPKVEITPTQLAQTSALSARQAAEKLGVGVSTVRRLRKGG